MNQPTHTLRARVIHWATNGMWTLMDHGLFAGSNFLLNILMARWLIQLDYGAFATAIAAYRLLATLYQALLSEPMLVLGAGRYQRCFSRYLGAVLIYGHVGFTLIGSVVVGLAALQLSLFTDQHPLALSLLMFAVAEPFILFAFMVRRACYVAGVPKHAGLGAILYAVILFGGLFVLRITGVVSTTTAFTMMGVAGLASGLYPLVRLRADLRRLDRTFGREVLREHWAYGRWMLGAGVLGWLPANIWYLVLPLWVGLHENAVLGALYNVNLMSAHVIAALSVLLIPSLTRTFQASQEQFRHHVAVSIGLFAAAGAAYWVILFFFGDQILSLLYSGKYTAYSYLLLILGLEPVSNAIGVVLTSALRAMERPDIIFYSFIIPNLVMMTVGLGLTYIYGLLGAVITQPLTSIVGVSVLLWYYRSPAGRPVPAADRAILSPDPALADN